MRLLDIQILNESIYQTSRYSNIHIYCTIGLAAAAALAAGKYGGLPNGLSPGAAAFAAAAAGNSYFSSVIKSGLAAASGPQCK